MPRPSGFVLRTRVFATLTLTLGLLAAGLASAAIAQSAAPPSPAASGSPAATGPVPDGTFVGTVYQYNGSMYTTTLVATDCEAGVVCGSTAYPALACGGTLTYNGPKDGHFEFTENITTGPGCDPVVVLQVTPMDPDTLDVRYFPFGDEAASATLHRQTAPASTGSPAAPSGPVGY